MEDKGKGAQLRGFSPGGRQAPTHFCAVYTTPSTTYVTPMAPQRNVSVTPRLILPGAAANNEVRCAAPDTPPPMLGDPPDTASR